MSIELAYNEAYATSAEADVFLASNATWLNLSKPEKDDALLWLRYYIHDNFDCYLSTLDAIPEELKYANSLLAADYSVDGTLYQTNTESGLKLKRVKAGDVETEKEYFEGNTSSSSEPSSIRQVRGLLSSICTRTSGTGTVNLVRA